MKFLLGLSMAGVLVEWTGFSNSNECGRSSDIEIAVVKIMAWSNIDFYTRMPLTAPWRSIDDR